MLKQFEGAGLCILMRADDGPKAGFGPQVERVMGGIAGGSGANLDSLDSRRFPQRLNPFPLKHLAQANGVKKI